MHVNGECSRACWIGSVLLFSHLKDWCSCGSLRSLSSTLTSVHGTWSEGLWTLTCSCCMTDREDLENVLHGSEMTTLLSICTFWRWADFTLPFSSVLLSLLTFLFLHLTCFTLHTFFSSRFHLLSRLLLSPNLSCFSVKRQGLIHSCIILFFSTVLNGNKRSSTKIM